MGTYAQRSCVVDGTTGTVTHTVVSENGDTTITLINTYLTSMLIHDEESGAGAPLSLELCNLLAEFEVTV